MIKTIPNLVTLVIAYFGARLMYSNIKILFFNGLTIAPTKLEIGRSVFALLVAGFVLFCQKFVTISSLIVVMIFFPFLFDWTFSYCRHLYSGENWQVSQKQFAIQRLIQAGWSDIRIIKCAFLMGILSLGFILCSIFFPEYSYSFFIINMMVVAYGYHAVECFSPMWAKQNQSFQT